MPNLNITLAAKKPQKGTEKEAPAKRGDKKIGSLSDYNIVGNKNLFRPQRKEWTPPPPAPKPKPKSRPKKKEPPPPPPPPPPDPLPEPELLGIIIDKTTGGKDIKVALMRGHKREEISVPATRYTRTRRRNYPVRKRYKIIQEPMGRYHVGDTISESKIVKIMKDRVFLQRDGEMIQVLLRDPTKKKKTSTTRGRTPTSRTSRSRRR